MEFAGAQVKWDVCWTHFVQCVFQSHVKISRWAYQWQLTCDQAGVKVSNGLGLKHSTDHLTFIYPAKGWMMCPHTYVTIFYACIQVRNEGVLLILENMTFHFLYEKKLKCPLWVLKDPTYIDINHGVPTPVLAIGFVQVSRDVLVILADISIGLWFDNIQVGLEYSIMTKWPGYLQLSL